MANVVVNGSTIGSVQPDAPTGLSTTTAFDGVQLDWTNPTNTPIEYIQIASSTVNNVAVGFTTVANVKTTAFYDHSTTAGTVYYWVRAVSTLGNIGPWNAANTAGTAGTPQEVTITSPVLGQVVVYDGVKWVNTSNVAVTTANAALTSTRISTSTSAARTAFRVEKIVNLSRAQGDGPNLVFNYEGTDGGYDIVGLRGAYDTGGDHNLVVFNSTATDNSLVPSAAIFVANSTQMTVSGNLIVPNSIRSTSASGGIGYGTGSGSTVTQLTSKTTAVTINTPTGEITMSNSALAAGFGNTFTVNNSSITSQDNVVVNIKSGATFNSYGIWANNIQNGSFSITLRNLTAATSYSEAVVVSYSIIRGSTS